MIDAAELVFVVDASAMENIYLFRILTAAYMDVRR